MDDIVDPHLFGIDESTVGTHGQDTVLRHDLREDSYASSAVPGFSGFAQDELESFESQKRGFQHGHRKVNGVPAIQQHEIFNLLKKKNPQVLQSLLVA